MPAPTRRGFLMGCSAAIANLAAARFTNVVFADPGTTPDHEVLVVLFLRGGMDGLNYVVPVAGVDRPHYVAARPTLAVPDTGPNAALELGELGGNLFGLHPGAAPLHDLWQDGRVAFVHACGLDTASRSHFDNQAQIELGTPGCGSTTTGWLTRHFLSAALPTRNRDAVARRLFDDPDRVSGFDRGHRNDQSGRLPAQHRTLGVARRAEGGVAQHPGIERRLPCTARGSKRSMPRR